MKPLRTALALIALSFPAFAQNPEPLGTVSPSDATVTSTSGPAVQLTGGSFEIPPGGTVTAHPGRNAEAGLHRGGSILVCQTTAVHMSSGSAGSLLLALDRGAMEIRMKSHPGDVVLTPDLRFSIAAPGELDLRFRVTFNGDTCVENRGRKSPALNVTDSFTNAAYLVKPGQHLMFEHGSLRTVADRETTPCGCPPDSKAPLTADAHPFPEAVSAGLAQPDPGAPEIPGVRHVQVDSTLQFDPSDPVAIAQAQAARPTTQPVEQQPGFFSRVGHFFKRLFVR